MANLIFDPYSSEFVDNPYPIYEAFRKQDPVHRTRDGFWLITRYEDVAALFSSKCLSNEPAPYAVIHERNRLKNPAADLAFNILPFMDPPRHTGKRRLLNSVFQARISRFEPKIYSLCTTLLETLRSQHEFDVVSDYGTPLSIQVMMRVLGLPDSDLEKIKCWTTTFFYLFAPIPSQQVLDDLDTAIKEFRAYLGAELDQRHEASGTDLLDHFASLLREATAPELSREEIIDNCILLFADGIENVDRALGTCVLHLCMNRNSCPDIIDQTTAAKLVEESLRLDSPAQLMGRIVKEDFEYQGKHIGKNQIVFLAIGSANRDPDKFPEPDRFNLERAKARSLIFGTGRHSCIGASLVNLELRVALLALLEKSQQLDLASSTISWENRFAHRWLTSLPVKVAWS